MLLGVPLRRLTSSTLLRLPSAIGGNGWPTLSRNLARSNWAMERAPLSCGVLSRSLTFSSPRARNWFAESFMLVHSAILAAWSTSSWPWVENVTVLPCSGSPVASPLIFMSSN